MGRKKVESTSKVDKARELDNELSAKLAELKENIGDNLCLKYKDECLIGFLRARSLNVKEAEKLVRMDDHLRKFLQMDDFIKNHELSELNRNYSCSGIIGCDKEGSLVRVLNIGYSDVKGYINCISTIYNLKLFIFYIERDRILQAEENKKTGKKCNQITYIVNLEHLSLNKIMCKPAIDTGIVALKLMQEHFHDIVKNVFVINAPSFYSTVLKLFKPVIQDDLHRKIRMYDDASSWKADLLKHIDADVLPMCYGGNRVEDDDETCPSIIRWGGTIPESYYLTARLDPSDPDVMCVTVPAGSANNYRFYVPKVGMRWTWQIHAKENDIGIGLFLDEHSTEEDKKMKKKKKATTEDTSKLIQLTPIIRSQCQLCPEIGYATTWFKGTVVLHLDNTYSWMSSKEVLLKIMIGDSE
ncbi:hypothetical protein JTE90_000119 [Oedothorax gibbosus]|uniref:CRAL-TRIO domain-containing protein n=1 Tax=Oedothorax gibbosus TaxID=931172 RepID=A0AAV6V0N0_9ARAC|nr:hypothetical protein JTE90_000119 [Oedothorax gibbosus]